MLAQQAVHAHGAQHEPNHVRPPPASQTPKSASPPLPPLSGRFTRTNLRFDSFPRLPQTVWRLFIFVVQLGVQAKVTIPALTEQQTRKLLEGSADFIYPHTAIIVRLDTTICSGVFAKSSDYHGMLTAGHCAELIMEKERVAFAVSELAHHLWVDCKSLDHVPIEQVNDNGPDLSFLIIKDVKLIELLKRQNKSFYDLDGQDVGLLQQSLVTTHWCICGSPREKLEQKYGMINSEVHVLNTTPCVCMQSRLIKIEFKGEYDYVHLELLTKTEGYPVDYTGASGSGIWYQRFVTTDGINYNVEPILAGIVAWQKPRKNNSRTIIGHCYHSIYWHVRKTLKDRRHLHCSPSGRRGDYQRADKGSTLALGDGKSEPVKLARR